MHTRLISVTLVIDAVIACAFGVVSWLRPVEIYGTIVDLEPLADHAGTVAALTSLSMFYALFGAVAAVAFFTPAPHRWALTAVLLLRHALSGLKGLVEAGAPWQIGDPIPDLVIHALFVLVYGIGLALAARAGRRERRA